MSGTNIFQAREIGQGTHFMEMWTLSPKQETQLEITVAYEVCETFTLQIQYKFI